MWLEASSKYNLFRYEPRDSVLRWKVDVMAEAAEEDGAESHAIGRILADELRRFEAAEQGEHPWDVADSDSSGLEAAYAALLDANGEFRQDMFECVADPIVYIYRFELHPDYDDCRAAVLDAFCRFFHDDAIILAQFKTTRLPLPTFKRLGFRIWTPTGEEPPMSPAEVEERTEFFVRDSALVTEFGFEDYPEECAEATPEHEAWLNEASKWEDLC